MLGRYFAAHFYAGLGLALAVLMAPFLLFAAVHHLGDVGRGDYGLGAALGQVLAETPRLLRDLLPVALLIGGTGACAWLARSGQLWVMRGAGCTGLRLASWILLAGLGVALLDLLNSEFLVAAGIDLVQRLERLRQPGRSTEFWLHGEQEHARLYWDPVAERPRAVTLYRYSADGPAQLRRVRQAAGADFDRGRWRLREVEEWLLEETPGGSVTVRRRSLSSVDWELDLSPRQLAMLSRRAEQLPLRRLLDSGTLRVRHGRSAQLHRLALWERLVRVPLLLLSALVALLLGAGVRPGGNLGRPLAAAAVLAIALHLGGRFSIALVPLLQLHPLVTVLPAAVLLLILGLFLRPSLVAAVRRSR